MEEKYVSFNELKDFIKNNYIYNVWNNGIGEFYDRLSANLSGLVNLNILGTGEADIGGIKKIEISYGKAEDNNFFIEIKAISPSRHLNKYSYRLHRSNDSFSFKLYKYKEYKDIVIDSNLEPYLLLGIDFSKLYDYYSKLYDYQYKDEISQKTYTGKYFENKYDIEIFENGIAIVAGPYKKKYEIRLNEFVLDETSVTDNHLISLSDYYDCLQNPSPYYKPRERTYFSNFYSSSAHINNPIKNDENFFDNLKIKYDDLPEYIKQNIFKSEYVNCNKKIKIKDKIKKLKNIKKSRAMKTLI